MTSAALRTTFCAIVATGNEPGMKLLIVGDSHTGALEMGRAKREKAGEMPADVDLTVRPIGLGATLNTQFWAARDDHAEITDEECRKRMLRLPEDGEQFDAIGFSMQLWFGRALRGFVDSDLTFAELNDGGQVVSDALFQRLVLADQRPALDLAVFIRSLGTPVFVVDPPTVFSENRYLNRISSQRLLAFVARHRAVMLAELARLDIPVVERPPKATDDAGFMRPEFARNDPSDRHHGNQRFGVMMIRRILEQAPMLVDPVSA